MVQLIVNADDLGLHPDLDRGILEAHAKGIVTSATLLVTGSSAQSAVRAAREQKLPLGVHLCLSTQLLPAAPAASVPSLLVEGRFRKSWAEVAVASLLGALHLEEVGVELKAQVRLARELGVQVDHLDTHQHLHLFPGIDRIVADLARKEGLPVRWPAQRPRAGWALALRPAAKALVLSALSFSSLFPPEKRVTGTGLFEAGCLNEDRLVALVSALEEGVIELGCHPGWGSPTVPEDPGWHYRWAEELAALCSPRVRQVITDRKIELTTYRNVFLPPAVQAM